VKTIDDEARFSNFISVGSSCVLFALNPPHPPRTLLEMYDRGSILIPTRLDAQSVIDRAEHMMRGGKFSAIPTLYQKDVQAVLKAVCEMRARNGGTRENASSV